MIKLFFHAIPHLGVVISLIWCMFSCIKEFLSIFAVVANGEMRNKDTYWMKEKGYIPRTYPIVFVIFLLCIKVSACWAYRDHRNRKVDSLEVVLRQPGLSWEDQLRAHSELMWGYIQTDGAKSIAHAKEIIKLTEKARGEGLLVRQNAFRILGQHAYGACLYDSAFHCYERSLEVTRQAEKSGRYSQEEIDDMYSALYGTIGNLYNIQGMPNIAMDYYLKALPIFQRYGWNESVSTLYYNMGEMFLEMGNNTEARNNYEQSLQAALETGDSLIISTSRYGLATALLNEGKPEDALRQLRVAIGYYRLHVDEESEALMNALVLESRIFWQGLDNIVKAQECMDEALALGQGMDGNTDLADAYSTQGELCLARKEWQQAVDWCLKSLQVNDQDPHHNIVVYKSLSEAYIALGNKEESTRYLNLLHATMTDMANQHYQAALSEMKVRYETQQKEMRIEQMEQRQRLFWWIATALVLLLLVIFLAYWRVNRQKQKTMAVEAKLKGEYDERRRLGRDLHDRLGGMLTATVLNLDQDKHEEAKSMLRQASAELRRVAHHLMPESLSSKGLEVALADYCRVLPNVQFSCFGEPRRLPESVEVACYSVVHELINNALRYADASLIQVQLMYENDSVSVVVSDNGCGFDVEAPHEGTGIDSIRERIRALGGQLTISSTKGEGTEVHFHIQVKQ